MPAVREELTRPGVMAAINDLTARGMSGVLEIEGEPSGRVYLDGGQIAYARASWVPGLAARLRAIAPSLVGQELPPGSDACDAIAAALVVGHGYLTATGLHELIKSIVVDAFLVLTIPLGEDYPVAAIRFMQAPASWTGLFPRLGLEAVRGAAVSQAEQMAVYGLAPTTVVAPRDLTVPFAVLTREQWAVACQIGERVSARELAMRRGASLSETVRCLGSLVRAGLCAPVPVDGHLPQSAGRARPADGELLPGAAAPPPAPPPAAPPREGLPALTPRQPWRPPHPVAQVQPPSIDLLRRVLTGLRRL